MDFGSEYIFLDEGAEDEKETPPSPVPEETYVEEYEEGGYECEVMEFDEEEEEKKLIEKERKVNTNTVKIAMSKLKENPDVMVEMSKLAECQSSSCGAAFSHLAKQDFDRKVWICSFCGTENDLKSELPDLVGKTDVFYVADPGKPPELKAPETSRIIFVIDTSASMSQTKPMHPNKASQNLKDIIARDKQRQLQELAEFGDIQGPAQNSSLLEVSRLQAIKASVMNVIDRLSTSDKRDMQLGLVTFHENVVVHGDGNIDVIVEGGQLADIEELKRVGFHNTGLTPVSQSATALKGKIELLKDFGRTALGPALVVAQGMASFVKGSKVILCTDGVANIGVGRLEETTDEEIRKFYDNIIDYSMASGVAVTIICVDDAGIQTRLGQVPSETGGSLQKIEATDLEQKIYEELNRETVAVGSSIKFVVHRDLYVSNSEKSGSKGSMCSQTIGNLQLDNQMSFSFAFKPDSSQQSQQDQSPSQTSASNKQDEVRFERDAHNSQEIMAVSQSQPMRRCDRAVSDGQPLPFQVQIHYTDLSGMQGVRIWTTERKMTRSRTQAEEAMNLKIVVENFLQEASKNVLEKMSDRRGYISLASGYSSEGHVYSGKLGHQYPDTHFKLTEFMTVMNSITRTHKITEDQITFLTKLKDARTSQVQG